MVLSPHAAGVSWSRKEGMSLRASTEVTEYTGKGFWPLFRLHTILLIKASEDMISVDTEHLKI